jgi:hypothetical protein
VGHLPPSASRGNTALRPAAPVLAPTRPFPADADRTRGAHPSHTPPLGVAGEELFVRRWRPRCCRSSRHAHCPTTSPACPAPGLCMLPPCRPRPLQLALASGELLPRVSPHVCLHTEQQLPARSLPITLRRKEEEQYGCICHGPTNRSFPCPRPLLCHTHRVADPDYRLGLPHSSAPERQSGLVCVFLPAVSHS